MNTTDKKKKKLFKVYHTIISVVNLKKQTKQIKKSYGLALQLF